MPNERVSSFGCAVCGQFNDEAHYAGCPRSGQIVEINRRFETGATRDTDKGKPDYEGYLSPLVLEAYGRYMLKHTQQADGTVRASDNWQLGIGKDVYIKSGWRHFMDWWAGHRGYPNREGMEDALCGVLFNCMGYLHEYLKEGGCDAQKQG